MDRISSFLNSTMTRRQARYELRARGWKFVGGGSFAAVYASPDGKTVAKVTKPDSGAEATYRASRSLRGNPHLPRYVKRLPLGNGGAVYQVERLEPFADWDDFLAAQSRSRYTDAYRAAMSALRDHAPAGINDVHWRNAMQRANGTLVMTDYLADMNELSQATVSAGDAEDGAFTAYDRHGSSHWLEEQNAEDDALLAELQS